jgi:hypothetical protein
MLNYISAFGSIDFDIIAGSQPHKTPVVIEIRLRQLHVQLCISNSLDCVQERSHGFNALCSSQNNEDTRQ